MDIFDADEVYNYAYENTYRFIKRGLIGKLEEDIALLETTVKTLLDDQGLDLTGRGDMYLAKNQASIAATEAVLYELKEELEK